MTLKLLKRLTHRQVEDLRTAALAGSESAQRDYVRLCVWRRLSLCKSYSEKARIAVFEALAGGLVVSFATSVDSVMR